MFTRDRTCPLTQEKWKPSHVEDEAPNLIGFTSRQKWSETRQCLFICANQPQIMFLISESNLIHFLTRPAFCTNHIMMKNFCHMSVNKDSLISPNASSEEVSWSGVGQVFQFLQPAPIAAVSWAAFQCFLLQPSYSSGRFGQCHHYYDDWVPTCGINI